MSEDLHKEQNEDLIARALADQVELERSGKFVDTEEVRRKQGTAFADELVDSGISHEFRKSHELGRRLVGPPEEREA